MSGSFDVVYDDLGTTAQAFSSESGNFLAAGTSLGSTKAADTGDDALTALVAQVLEIGAWLCDDLRDATFAHASKLGQCAQSYQSSDARCEALFRALTS